MAMGLQALAKRFEVGKWYRFSIKNYLRSEYPNDAVEREQKEMEMRAKGSIYWQKELDGVCVYIANEDAVEAAGLKVSLTHQFAHYGLVPAWCVQITEKQAAKAKRKCIVGIMEGSNE